jgi:hypothetical protein
MLKDFFSSITHNVTSLVGTALAVASLVLMACLFMMQQFGFEGGPYIGILTFLILPVFFLLGLLLIPIGAMLHRRKLRRMPGGEATESMPVFDLNKPATQRWILVFVGATMLNIVILASASFKGVHYMESTEFCGLACHSVMEPEHTAHQRSPHSRVSCADCHIGPGADWFVKSKLDGAWQLVSVAFDLYPRPVPTPLHDLRPARDTCEQCHWPTKHIGDKLRVIKHYKEDEASTELTTALVLKVGGVEGSGGTGIHWHVSPDVDIRYRSDDTREDVYEVEMTRGDGTVTSYANRKAPEEGGIWRSMDCVDCHNRPSHIYSPAADEVDRVIREGRVDRSLPWVKREALRIVDAEFESHEVAREQIREQLRGYYAENYPDVLADKTDAIDEAAEALGDIYSVNVFPQMNVWWDTYPNHIGHEQSDGCTRCHNRKMRTEDRVQIRDDCDICHIVIAEKEESPDLVTMLQSEGIR